MNKLQKFIHDLTGTPYITIWFIGKGVVTKVKHYKMDEKIENEYGHFKTPMLENLIFKKNVYYGMTNIENCKEMVLVKKPLTQKIIDKVSKSKKYTENKIKEIDIDEFVITGLSPQDLQSYLESQTIASMMKSTKKQKFDINTIVMVIVGLAGAFIAYKLFLGGGL
jgi:hypothetical protein